jgi:ABC-type nickel/cobalt efflux system permease component RcnA
VTSVTVPAGRRGALSRAATRDRRVRHHDGAEPWARRDALLPGLLTALGLIGLIVGWLGISNTVALSRQSRWLGLGIGAVVLGGLGVVLWLFAGLTNLGRLRREVLGELALRAAEDAQDDPFEAAHDARFGIATGMRRHHRADCELLAGKTVTWLEADEVPATGTAPCGICRPEVVGA